MKVEKKIPQSKGYGSHNKKIRTFLKENRKQEDTDEVEQRITIRLLHYKGLSDDNLGSRLKKP